MTGSYRIIGESYAHDGPIRCMSIGPLGEVVTGCQSDSPNIKRWAITEQSLDFMGSPIFHDHWVTAVTSSAQLGFIVTGCMDCKIRVYDTTGNPVMALEGHEKGVISLSWTAGGSLISGSWDGTAKIWDLSRNGQLTHSLGPHENGVNVLGLPDGRIATTSTGEAVDGKPANYKLRLWDGTTAVQIGESISDHSGSIRSITMIPGLDGFATTSNDGTIALRGSDGAVVGSMMHPPQEDCSPPFVLCCSLLSTSTGMSVVTGAEDGSVMVCDGMEVVQNIPHPTCVWCVLGLPGGAGDFVTGGHDGVLRYFSKDPRLTQSDASGSLQIAFNGQVETALAKKSKGPSSEEIAKQAKWEARANHPGKSEGQVMVFNKDGKMIAAQWSSDSSTWIEIGEVTGSGDGGDVNGVRYDHVLPVEIDMPGEGAKCLNIGYNNLESPFDAAQRFIDENGLGQHYLRQIAEWISDRAGKSTPTLGAASTSSSSTVTAAATVSHFPAKAYALFDEIPAGFQGKIIPKITEFNNAVGDLLLTATELESVDFVVSALTATSRYHSSTISSKQLNGVVKMATQWDDAKTFPAFDLCRMLGLHPDGSRSLSSHPMVSNLFVRASQLLGNQSVPANTTVTALRFLVNCFRFDELRKSMLTALSTSLLNIIEIHASSSNKLIRVSVSSLLLNYSIHLAGLNGASADVTAPLLQSAIALSYNILSRETENVDVINRSLLTIGTITITSIKYPLSPPVSDLINSIAALSVLTKLNEVKSVWGSRLGNLGVVSLQELIGLYIALA